MKKRLRSLVLKLLPSSLANKIIEAYARTKFALYGAKAFPPPKEYTVKVGAITSALINYKYDTLVETGTYMGDMVAAQLNNFSKIYSIEIAHHLARAAKRRFKDADNVEIIEGDSATKLTEIVDQLDSPAIFWLDGHYSAGVTERGISDCPIYGELSAIFNSSNREHVILIDDADDFDGTGDYPSQEAIAAFVQERAPGSTQRVLDNIIWITPTKPQS